MEPSKTLSRPSISPDADSPTAPPADAASEPLAPRRLPTRRRTVLLGSGAVLAFAGLVLLAGRHFGLPPWAPWPGGGRPAAADSPCCPDDHADQDHADHADQEDSDLDHAGHDHGAGGSVGAQPGVGSHPGHVETNALALSAAGRKNVGLQVVAVELRDFDRTVTMPATVVERAGRSQVTVSAPMTGIVTRIDPLRGEAVLPGQRLFELRLTHEDLVEKQSELLRDLQQLDVVRREVARLEEVTESGAVAGKTLLERNYEQQKLEAAVNAAVQGLRLHGLSEPQIESIVEQRQLLESVEIVAPASGEAHAGDDHQGFLQFTEVLVRQGDHVTAGTPLGVLSDHCQLYLEGLAFEQDSPLLNRLANEGVALSAVVDANGPAERVIGDLRVLYVENQVELESRALRFYVPLANELVRNETTPDGHRFIGWRFRPGQRVELRLPVETWKGRLVLPAEAVVREGAESYVFQQNDGHFDRLNVHLLHSDSHWAVIEPDGVLAPGDLVAGKGAYQLHLALKNRSGAGIDPHAGHGH